MELFHANRQWAERPPDERFWNVEEMAEACIGYAKNAREAETPFNRLTCVAGENENIMVQGPERIPATLTNWSFKQLSARAGAPAEYLQKLPVKLATGNLNFGLSHSRSTALMLLHPVSSQESDTRLILRAATTDRYERFWNWEICDRLLDLPPGWRTPPARPNGADPRSRPATQADVLDSKGGGGGLSISVGDMIAPSGLYASDHDMFGFFINEGARIKDGTDGGMSRGFFVSNSEVGDGSFWFLTFMYRHVCGNHIVWGASGVQELRIPHVGRIRERIDDSLIAEVRKYADASASFDEAMVERAKRFSLGTNKDEVLDLIFGKKLMSRKQAGAAFEIAQEHDYYDGDARTAWGFAQGVTRLAQQTAHTDRRVDMDRTASKILTMAF